MARGSTACACSLNITQPGKQNDGSFHFSFTNTPGKQFSVLSAASLAVPFANWTPVGSVLEISPGQFQFRDPLVSRNPVQFYRVISP